MMRRIVAYRANRILYSFIKRNQICGSVIVPANICQSVVDTLILAGMNLIYVDISKDTLCADRASVIKVAPYASLFIFVHTYGVEMECPEWFSEVRKVNPGIVIIDDRCLCMPQQFFREELADLVLFSCCPKKQVDLGIGGIGFISGKLDYDEIPVEANPVLTNDIWQPEFDRMEQVRIAVSDHKSRLNRIYAESLPLDIQLNERFQHWRFNILVPQKDLVLQSIFDAGVFASSHYKSLSDSCSVATQLQSQVINLFNDFYYTEDQAIRTCEVIKRIIS